jgi:hypothetical protein
MAKRPPEVITGLVRNPGYGERFFCHKTANINGEKMINYWNKK